MWSVWEIGTKTYKRGGRIFLQLTVISFSISCCGKSTQQHYGLGEAGSKRGVFYNMVEDIKSSTTVIVVIGRLVGGYFATTSHTPE